MQYIEQLLGIELGLPARFLIAFVVVMLLIALTAAVIRGFAGSRIPARGKRGNNLRQRLAVGEWIAVDDKRRLVLVRRDDVEHLLLIGGDADLVVETDTGNTKPQAVAAVPIAPPQPDVLDPPQEPRAPAIDLAYRSPLRIEQPEQPQAAPAKPVSEFAPAPKKASPVGAISARLQREADKPAARATAAGAGSLAAGTAAADNASESAASQALAEALDMDSTSGKNGKSSGKEDPLAEALAKELDARD